MNKKKMFLTDSSGIFAFIRTVKAVVLKNLETGELRTVETIGGSVEGFETIKIPRISADERQKAGKGRPAKPKRKKINKDRPAKPKRKKIRKGKTSQFFGVSFNKKKKKKPWRVSLWFEGKVFTAVYFETEIEAAVAVDEELVRRGLPKRNFP